MIYYNYGIPKDIETETINVILYIFIIPVILIGGTITICLLVGLPIRLIHKLYSWWLTNSYIAFIGLTVGLLIIIFSSHFTQTIKVIENRVETMKEIPNETVLEVGWFVTAFFLLHIYPIRFIENILTKFKSKRKTLDWTNQW